MEAPNYSGCIVYGAPSFQLKRSNIT